MIMLILVNVFIINISTHGRNQIRIIIMFITIISISFTLVLLNDLSKDECDCLGVNETRRASEW